MKKVQPSGARKRKKRELLEKKQSLNNKKRALDTWIKRSRVEVEEIGNNEAAKNSSDTGMESEHNNNSTGTEFLKSRMQNILQ